MTLMLSFLQSTLTCVFTSSHLIDLLFHPQDEEAQRILREEMEKDRRWRERVAAEAALGSLVSRKARSLPRFPHS